MVGLREREAGHPDELDHLPLGPARVPERPALEGGPEHLDACWLPREDRQGLRHEALERAVRAGDPGQTELTAEPAAPFEVEAGPVGPAAQP